MWIAWNTAVLWALALLGIVVVTRTSPRPWALATATAARELALVFGLYALWQYVHHLTIRQVNGAEEHARWVWEIQRWLHLPSEVSLQQLVLPHEWLTQFFNGYYAAAHGTGLLIGLVWLFVRHRESYSPVRNSLVIVTGLCL